MSLIAFVFSENSNASISVNKYPVGLGLDKRGAFHESNTTFGKKIPILFEHTF